MASNLITLSRQSTVKIVSQTAQSSGSGFFIADRTVATCFHVAGDLTSKNAHPDLVICLPSGEIIRAEMTQLPTSDQILYDFALLTLHMKPTSSYAILSLATDTNIKAVGDELVFSGYPLATPGMVTQHGVISGQNNDGSLIFIDGSINKGNSGGAALNAIGQALGIISMREGGVSQGLNQLIDEIDQLATYRNSRPVDGVDLLQAMRELIQVLAQYISTGIGYARDIKFLREFVIQNPHLLK